MNKIFYLNEDGNDDMRNTLNGSVQGKVHTFSKAQMAYLMKYYKQFVCEINLQSDLFANIQFPTLPHNFEMLMSELDFPSKAKVNINNSLFLKPQDIDSSSAEDIGLQLFNSNKFKNKTGVKMTLFPGAWSREFESIGYMFDEIALRQLFEDTASGSGVDIKPQDIKSYNDSMEQLNADVISSIDAYVTKSIEAVKPLLEMVGGGSNASSVLKSIQTADEASHTTVSDWLDSVSAIRKESSESMRSSQLSAFKDRAKYTKSAIVFLGCIAVSNIPGNMPMKEYYNIVSERAQDVSNKSDLDEIIREYSYYKKYDDFLNDYRTKGKGKPFAINLKPLGNDNNESVVNVKYSYLKRLNEDALDRFEEDQTDTSADKPVDYDKVYHDIFHYISRAMSSAIGERDNWLCFKDVRQNMENLVKGADEEITKKIELVCKTGGQKSLVHWPFKAEGLKGMWKRYMSELQLRINNRIDQLTGSHGSATTGSAAMVEQFLLTTYPQIIAMMITYKCVFEQLKEMYSHGFMARYTFEDCEDIVAEFEDQFSDHVRIFQNAWNNRDRS